jgi:ATP-dependent exoDNAse (exonuclease V) beta subunit
MNPIRERIMASAGTGKTFTLAGRFLKLLFQEVPPAEILATTFTRKAAGEILERVLGWLANAELADSPDPDLQQIGERALADLRKATELGEEINPQRCRTLLAGLIQNLDTFNVRTLDSFFVESAKVFALELGLPLDWEIVDDHADGLLRSEALSQLLGPQQQVEVFGLLNEMTAARSMRALSKWFANRSIFIEIRPSPLGKSFNQKKSLTPTTIGRLYWSPWRRSNHRLPQKEHPLKALKILSQKFKSS